MTLHPTRRIVRGLVGFLAVVLVPAAVSAQVTAGTAPSVSFSIVGGVNSAGMSLPVFPFEEEAGFDVDMTNGNRLGFIGGLFVEVPVNRRVRLDTGALVSTRGARVDMTAPLFGTATADLRTVYLDFPLLVRAPIAGSGQHRLSLLAGATIGARLTARARVEAGNQSEEMDFTSEFPAADFGLTLGGRGDIGRGVVIVYYTFGLTDLTKGEAPSAVRHRVLTILGGIRF